MILHKAEKRKLDGDDAEILAAGRQGLYAALTRLLRHNAELVYARDSFWNTPLMLACREGKLKVAKQLAEAGSSVNSTNRVRSKCATVQVCAILFNCALEMLAILTAGWPNVAVLGGC